MADELAPVEGNTAKDSPSDRRVWVRQPCLLDTMCQPGEGRLDQFWWLAQVQDLSRSGIRLILGHRFDPGTILAVALQSDRRDEGVTIQARVVHANTLPVGGFATGCVFTRELTTDEFRDLLG